MVPRVGARNLVSRLKKVVLPAPLGPMRAWMSPRLTFRSTLFTATKPLNSLVRPWVSRIVSADNTLLQMTWPVAGAGRPVEGVDGAGQVAARERGRTLGPAWQAAARLAEA